MFNTMKDYLLVAVIIALGFFAYAAVSYVNTYDEAIEPSSFRSFSAMGEGKVVTVPDVAEFSFSVVTEGGLDIAALQKQNTEKNNKAIDFVKSKGVEAKDIKTESYSLNPRYQYFDCTDRVYSTVYSPSYGAVSSVGSAVGVAKKVEPCPPPEIVGYTITQSVVVKVRDFAKVGDILSGVVKSGANSVSSLSFRVDNPEAVQAEARTQAIAKAKEKAKALAHDAGFGIGRLLSITEGYSSDRLYYAKATEASGIGGGDSAASPSIEAGSQEVTVTMTLTYEIK